MIKRINYHHKSGWKSGACGAEAKAQCVIGGSMEKHSAPSALMSVQKGN